MANDVTGNPVILDTASTTAVVISNFFKIKAIVWDQGASGANTDACVIKDKHGAIKYSQTILTGNLVPQSIEFAPPLDCDGLIMHTLGHGTVYVYWDGPQPIA